MNFSRIAGLVCLVAFSASVSAWQHESYRWEMGRAEIVLSLEESRQNLDAIKAMEEWNDIQSSPFRFSWSEVPDLQPSCGIADNVNVVVMARANCDKVWSPTEYAVTLVLKSDNVVVDVDVLFNAIHAWRHYDHSWDPSYPDFKRIAMHEFGHVAGLAHTDSEIDPVAIMNEPGDTFQIQQDDQDGLAAKYPIR